MVHSGLAGRGVGGHGLGGDHRAGALVVDAGDGGDRLTVPVDRQRAVQLDRLLAVDEHGRVEACRSGRTRPPPPATTTGKVGRTRWVDVLAVLGGELELEPGRIGDAGADAEGVEQAVLGVPGRLVGFAGVPDGIRIDRHGWTVARVPARAAPPARRPPSEASGEDLGQLHLDAGSGRRPSAAARIELGRSTPASRRSSAAAWSRASALGRRSPGPMPPAPAARRPPRSWPCGSRRAPRSPRAERAPGGHRAGRPSSSARRPRGPVDRPASSRPTRTTPPR